MAKGKSQIQFASTMGDKGIPKINLPGAKSGKKGGIQFAGQEMGKGVPPKAPGKGKGSKWAGTHD
mgnify:CR=1 FL=1